MKRLTYIFIISLGIILPSLFQSRPTYAQYFSYAPIYYYGYGTGNCLTGCGRTTTIVNAISLGLAAVDTALQIHYSSKANEALAQQYQYQAEAYKSIANYPQRMVDYYNILRVNSFFQDDVPHYPTGQNSPRVKSFSKKKSSEVLD